MNSNFPPASATLVKGVDCHNTLARLIGNLSGFLYRRRLDPRWTMDFVSEGALDITGYDAHRFIGNASVSYADLIARSDWERVHERVQRAVLERQRATVEYIIRTAPGVLLPVEDRFTPVFNAAGEVIAIEGIIDLARTNESPLRAATSVEARLAALCNSAALN